MGLDVVALAEPSRPWAALSLAIEEGLARAPARWRPDPDGLPSGLIDLGPADPITLQLREGLLIAHARTAQWGPGYHRTVVACLDAIGPAVSGWRRIKDDAGWSERRDARELCRAFLRWGFALWSLDAPPGRPPSAQRDGSALLDGVRVCLGVAEGPVEVPRGLVATPTGFKGRRWIAATRDGLREALLSPHPERPGPAARAAFLWWHEEPDPFDWVQLGRAVCTTDVIWRPVHGEDAPEQRESRALAVACFEQALRLDPAAPVPREELRRLYALLDQPDLAATVGPDGDHDEGFWGGYREGWIRLPVGGRWHVALPGWLRAGVDATDGHDVFWDDELTVHVTCARGPADFSAPAEARRHVARLPGPERTRAQVELLGDGPVSGYVVVLPASEGRDTLVQGQVVCARERIGFTVVARSAAASAAALRLGRSLRPLGSAQ